MQPTCHCYKFAIVGKLDIGSIRKVSLLDLGHSFFNCRPFVWGIFFFIFKLDSLSTAILYCTKWSSPNMLYDKLNFAKKIKNKKIQRPKSNPISPPTLCHCDLLLSNHRHWASAHHHHHHYVRVSLVHFLCHWFIFYVLWLWACCWGFWFMKIG